MTQSAKQINRLSEEVFVMMEMFSVIYQGFPGGTNGKESPASAGDVGLIPVSGRSPGEGNSNPLCYSCLGNPIVRGTWWATVRGVTKNSDLALNNNTNFTAQAAWISFLLKLKVFLPNRNTFSSFVHTSLPSPCLCPHRCPHQGICTWFPREDLPLQV